jgi:hypothetical protein
MTGWLSQERWLRLVVFFTAAALPSLAVAAAPVERDEASVLFSLQRARRAQQREATPGAPYRSNLPWPVGAEDESRRRWAMGTAGPEWDDQPVLLSNGIGPPEEIAGDDHAAGVWFFDVGAELFDKSEFSGGLAASYWGAAYSAISFDTHFPTLSPWIDWNISETAALRMGYNFGHAWVDLDSFATTHFVGPRFFKSWGRAGDSQFRAEYYDYDFHVPLPDVPTEDLPIDGLCITALGSPPAIPSAPSCGPEEKSEGSRMDRSGWGFIFSGEHRVRLDWNDSEIRGGYTYQHYIPDGPEFHNQSHEIWLGATTDLLLGFVFDSNVTFLYQSARNPSSYPDPDTLVPNEVYKRPGYRRHDRIWRVYAAIGRKLARHASASLEYGFSSHDSNLDVFDYDRHRIGGYLTVHFD